jgi:hypothetical protein
LAFLLGKGASRYASGQFRITERTGKRKGLFGFRVFRQLVKGPFPGCVQEQQAYQKQYGDSEKEDLFFHNVND